MESLGPALVAILIGTAVLAALFWPYGRLSRPVMILRLGFLLLILGSSAFGMLATLELEAGSDRLFYQVLYGSLLVLTLGSGIIGIRHLIRARESAQRS